MKDLKIRLKLLLNTWKKKSIDLEWINYNTNSKLASIITNESLVVPNSKFTSRIEFLAEKTNFLGKQQLWEGYDVIDGKDSRNPNEVRTYTTIGNFYSWLVKKTQPGLIVEFGTAFGVSGMYFLAGLEEIQQGRLLSFEVNTAWAKIARENLNSISQKFDLINGTFEDNISVHLKKGEIIDIALIDAIHTRQFVQNQLDIVLGYSKQGTIIILDDINYSLEMEECWQEISHDTKFRSSASIGQRVGIVEVD